MKSALLPADEREVRISNSSNEIAARITVTSGDRRGRFNRDGGQRDKRRTAAYDGLWQSRSPAEVTPTMISLRYFKVDLSAFPRWFPFVTSRIATARDSQRLITTMSSDALILAELELDQI